METTQAPPCPIVFIHLGLEPIDYLENNLQTAASFSPTAVIIVVMNRDHPLRGKLGETGRYRIVAMEDLPQSAAHAAFQATSRLDRTFRGGFWHFAVERLFVLDEVWRALSLSPGFHVESDNLIFFDAPRIAQRLMPLYSGIAAPFDADDRCIPSILFINDPQALARLATFMAEQTEAAPIKSHMNDMRLLAMFRQKHPPNLIDGLPIVPPSYPGPLRSKLGKTPADPALYTRHLDEIRSIFDAAALGQYIYGVEPRSAIGHRDTHGFVNETCVFDASRLRYVFLPGPRGRAQPYVETASGLCPINNLHLHSKRILRPEPGPVPRYAYGALPKAKKKLVDGIDDLGRAMTRLRRSLKPAKKSRPAEGTPGHHAAALAAFKAQPTPPTEPSVVAIDCLIVAAAKDAGILPYTVEGLRRNLAHPSPRIVIIGQDDPALRELADRIEVEFVSERKVLSITKADIDYTVAGVDRSGWLFQQLLKLGGDAVAKTANYLVIDADTVLVRPQAFLRGNHPVLLHSDEHHAPYFDVAGNLLGHRIGTPLSHVAHMMLFSADRLDALRRHLEGSSRSKWYDAIIAATRRDTASGFSEFELYGQWCEMNYPKTTAHEYWHGLTLSRDALRSLPELEHVYGPSYRAVSFHSYVKRRP